MPAATVKNFGFGTQIRKSPFFDATVRWGATDFSVYNHMYIPRSFGDPEQNCAIEHSEYTLRKSESKGTLVDGMNLISSA